MFYGRCRYCWVSLIQISDNCWLIQSSIEGLLNLCFVRSCITLARMTETAEELSQRIGELVMRYQAIKEEETGTSKIVSQLVHVVKPEPIKIIKTASMTYSEFLAKVLNQVSVSKLGGLSGRSSYKLVEDLHIILALSKQTNITPVFFQELSKSGKLNRSAESIRGRYNQVLCHIGEADMKKITDHLQQGGIDGYLVYVEEEIRIISTDPKDLPSGKRLRPESLDKEQKMMERKSKRNVPHHLSQLNDILDIYSRVVNVPMVELMQILDQVSGDMVAMDWYIETRDQRLLWSDQEDQVLRNGGSELKVLKRYRTDKDIQTRKTYLQN